MQKVGRRPQNPIQNLDQTQNDAKDKACPEVVQPVV